MQRTRFLRRRAFKRSSHRSSYARRERDFDRMADVRAIGCVVREVAPYLFAADVRAASSATRCCGNVEADHVGRRALGRKADDSTTVGLCQQHHRERTDHSGTFKYLTKYEARAWCDTALEYVDKAVKDRHAARAA